MDKKLIALAGVMLGAVFLLVMAHISARSENKKRRLDEQANRRK